MRHPGQDGLVVSKRVEAVCFGGADEAEMQAQRLGAGDCVGEQEILPCQDKGFDLLLGEVIVGFEPTIVEECTQALPMR